MSSDQVAGVAGKVHTLNKTLHVEKVVGHLVANGAITVLHPTPVICGSRVYDYGVAGTAAQHIVRLCDAQIKFGRNPPDKLCD